MDVGATLLHDLSSVTDADEDETGPIRRCIATGERRPKEALIRFVVAPDGSVVADLDGRLPGRGIHVGAHHDLIARVIQRGSFARAARRQLRVSEDLPARVDGLLVDRVVAAIGFARRARAVAAGFDQAADRLRTGVVDLLLQARDGAPEPRARLATLATGRAVLEPLDGDQMGRAFDRDRLVHLAVWGPAARALAAAASRLILFRTPVRA